MVDKLLPSAQEDLDRYVSLLHDLFSTASFLGKHAYSSFHFYHNVVPWMYPKDTFEFLPNPASKHISIGKALSTHLSLVVSIQAIGMHSIMYFLTSFS